MKRRGAKNDDDEILYLSVCSDLRKNIIICLNEGKKSLSELRSELEISSTTAIHALRELEKYNLTSQGKDKKYVLTRIGKIIALKLMDFSAAAEVLKKHERFWLDHDLCGIPEHLLVKIGWLKESSLIQINALDIIKTHNTYVDFIKNAKWIKGVSPIFSSDYPVVFKSIIERGVSTQLVLTEAVFKKAIDSVGIEAQRHAMRNYPYEIFITDEDLKVAFTVTDVFFSLGLFTNYGIYDTTLDLISIDERAVKWGLELFEYYKGRAKKCEL